ncbi:hypothetical protein P43SY_001384 [Pythium insidiosum]|uniref:Uncharacterized protein n=1 Tax=Pythium insidiosum TaxID=114742 RepID=A0AAD5LPJ3_PYTIN|nr:hypothetical protein P43SY_001384 [Pythium insidiosum]
MVRHSIVATASLVVLVALCFTSVQVEATSLRREDETWRLLGEATEVVAAPLPPQETSLLWEAAAENNMLQMKPVDKIDGSDAMLVFHDQAIDGLAPHESALVSFDVLSNPNCVVSVCGLLRKWYMGYGEQCWGLKIAPKSSDPAKNGLISGISAAYTAVRPVASKMYLKFDSVNYIDGSKCNYEIIKGTKKITKDPTPNVEMQR